MSVIKATGEIPGPRGADAADAVSTPTAPTSDTERVAREFEAIFVRTLLRSTPIGAQKDAYGDLGVDALAKSITEGRGLGLADRIRDALESLRKKS